MSTRYTLIFNFKTLKMNYLVENYERILEVLKKILKENQLVFKNQLYVFRKSWKCIGKLFSQLIDQFIIRRNDAKSFQGFKTRVLSKITILTVVQYINKFIFDRNINNIKISII